jgi:site-specific DNA recombinase
VVAAIITAVYVRVSSEEQVEKGYSLAEQERVCREKALALGASQVIVYADEGISGGILERPALLRLREAIRRKEIAAVLCRDPDRLSRTLAHQLIIADECEKYGVRLEFTGWDWQRTPEGQLFFAIRGAVSQYEKEKIRERMKRGKVQKAISGLEPNRIQVFGYRYDAKGLAFVDDYEARVIMDIFQWFTAENIGITGINTRLNDMGITGPGGKRWYKQTVRYILSNSTYVGKHFFNMRDETGLKNNKYTKEKSRVTRKPENEWIVIPFPPIISESVFTSTQEKLGRCRRLWAGKPRALYLLSGLLRCGDCGQTMVGMKMHYNRGDEPPYYSCRRETLAKGSYCLPRKYIKGTPIEDAVWGQVISWIQQPQKIFEYVKELQGDDGAVDERLLVINEQLQTVEKGRRNILDVLASGTTTLDETTKVILKQLMEREQALRKQVRELQAKKLRASMREINGINAAGQVLCCHLDKLTPQEKKEIIRAFVSEIIIHGRGNDISIEILANIPVPEVLSQLVERIT